MAANGRGHRDSTMATPGGEQSMPECHLQPFDMMRLICRVLHPTTTSFPPLFHRLHLRSPPIRLPVTCRLRLRLHHLPSAYVTHFLLLFVSLHHHWFHFQQFITPPPLSLTRLTHHRPPAPLIIATAHLPHPRHTPPPPPACRAHLVGGAGGGRCVCGGARLRDRG